MQTVQLNKIRNAYKKARESGHGFKWLWIDTCCINKSNAVEEQESINSMFKWYRKAAVCYVNLHDVVWAGHGRHTFASLDPERHDQKAEWFTRRWTLQELLASSKRQFCDRNWYLMEMGGNLTRELASVISIEERYLSGDSDFRLASVVAK